MSFEFLAILALATLASGVVACIAFYCRRIASPRPGVLRYFGLAIVVAFASYLAGSFTGIGVMCAGEDAGNLCGIWGALVSGPIVAGLVLWLFGPVYRGRTSR